MVHNRQLALYMVNWDVTCFEWHRRSRARFVGVVQDKVLRTNCPRPAADTESKVDIPKVAVRLFEECPAAVILLPELQFQLGYQCQRPDVSVT